MNIRERLMQRLKTLRKRAGLSARSLSLKIGRSEYHISRIENGMQYPSIEDLEKIADACGSTLEEIFSEDFESYNIDKKLIDMLHALSTREKDIALTVLLLLLNKGKEEERIKEKKI